MHNGLSILMPVADTRMVSDPPEEDGTIPEWDLADRLRKALRYSDLRVQELAAYLDVSRNTVSNWINGRVEPSVQSQRLWALRTGVPYSWLAGRRNPDNSE